MLARLLLLADSPTPAPSEAPVSVDPDRVTPGLIGLAFVLMLVVALYLLWRSMNKQLKRIDFPESSTEAPPANDHAPRGP